MAKEKPYAANDGLADAADALQAEVDRAIRSLRAALSEMAKRQCLHPSLMGVINLIDRTEFHVTFDVGTSAFELDENVGIVHFRSSGLEMILVGADAIASEIGIGDSEGISYLRQLTVNLFIAHELLHICQNFPHFSSVADIKKGIPGIGLPLLDAVADIVSASICAHAECIRLDEMDEKSFLVQFSNTLVVSYIIGSFVFDAKTNPGKRQRALGLVVAAIMIQALAEGRLIRENVNPAWKPTSPLLLLDISVSGKFNALVVDEIAGVLFLRYEQASQPLSLELWNSVGDPPMKRTLELVSALLVEIKVIKRA